MNKKRIEYGKIINYIVHIVLVILAIMFVWMVFAESFSTNLCNEVSTCYTVAIFLVGILITLKIKILDERKNNIELFLFALGILVNLIFFAVAFGYDCASIKTDLDSGIKTINPDKVKAVILILNAIIWIDFIVLIRNIYLVFLGYIRHKHQNDDKASSIIGTSLTDKNVKVYKKSNWGYISLFILLFSLILVSFLLNNYLSSNEDKHSDFYIAILTAVISGFCAIVGGICTLVGVRKTIAFERERDKEKNKFESKPELYIPFKYDVANAVQIRIKEEDGKESPILNKRIVLKNSSKVAFRIIEFFLNGQSYNSNLNIWIEPDILFALSFNYGKCITQIRLVLISVEGSKYECNIGMNDSNPSTLEVNDVSN